MYAVALGLTLLAEVPIVAVCAARVPALRVRADPGVALAALVALIANVASHVTAFGIVWPLLDRPAWALVPIELIVVAAEAALFSRSLRWPWWPSLVVSATANVASVAIGAWTLPAT